MLPQCALLGEQICEAPLQAALALHQRRHVFPATAEPRAMQWQRHLRGGQLVCLFCLPLRKVLGVTGLAGEDFLLLSAAQP